MRAFSISVPKATATPSEREFGNWINWEFLHRKSFGETIENGSPTELRRLTAQIYERDAAAFRYTFGIRDIARPRHPAHGFGPPPVRASRKLTASS